MGVIVIAAVVVAVAAAVAYTNLPIAIASNRLWVSQGNSTGREGVARKVQNAIRTPTTSEKWLGCLPPPGEHSD